MKFNEKRVSLSSDPAFIRKEDQRQLARTVHGQCRGALFAAALNIFRRFNGSYWRGSIHAIGLNY